MKKLIKDVLYVTIILLVMYSNYTHQVLYISLLGIILILMMASDIIVDIYNWMYNKEIEKEKEYLRIMLFNMTGFYDKNIKYISRKVRNKLVKEYLLDLHKEKSNISDMEVRNNEVL